jgi:hypothetical protein
MPLHRDIHWLGRQWAVTGHGLQLINQKQMGYYDIEVSRLWEAGLIQSMQGKAWIDRPDFDKALELARARFFDEAPEGETPPVAVVASPPAAPPVKKASVEPPSLPALEDLLAKLKTRSGSVAPAVKPTEAASAAPPKVEPPKSEPPKLGSPNPEPPKPAEAAPVQLELPKPEPDKPAPLSPATVTAAPSDPAPPGRPGPVWPVFGHKVAGSARFVRPWRARLTGWHRSLPGLPPRP